MPGARHLPAYIGTQLPAWMYLGGETLSTPDNETLNMPDSTSTIVISTETGACYYAINGIASANSPGYIAADGMQTIGPIANLTSVNVHSPAGTVHVQYFHEA